MEVETKLRCFLVFRWARHYERVTAVAKCGQTVIVGDPRVQGVILVAELKEWIHIVSLFGIWLTLEAEPQKTVGNILCLCLAGQRPPPPPSGPGHLH